MATITTNTTTSLGTMSNPVVHVSGTWDSATATVKVNGTSLLTTYTADFEKRLNYDRPVEVEITTSGGGGSLSLTAVAY